MQNSLAFFLIFIGFLSQNLSAAIPLNDHPAVQKFQAPESSQTFPSDYVIGGFNITAWLGSVLSSENIRHLVEQSLKYFDVTDEVAFQNLEAKLNGDQNYNSLIASLADGESLKSVLEKDFQKLQSLQVSQQEIGLALLKIFEFYLSQERNVKSYFEFRGLSFEVSPDPNPLLGYEHSAFGEPKETSGLKIILKSRGRQIEIDRLQALYIYRYGFFGGSYDSGKRRLDPEFLVYFLGFKQN